MFSAEDGECRPLIAEISDQGSVSGRNQSCRSRVDFTSLLLFLCTHGRQLPGGAVLQQTRNQGRLHGVPRPLGYHVTKNMMAGQREIADQVQDLVPHELVFEAQGTVQHPLAVEDNGARFGDAPDQSHVPQLLLVFFESERPRWGDLHTVIARSEIDDESLAADRRGKIDLVRNAVSVARIDSDKLVAFAHLNRLEDPDILSPPSLGLQANLLESLHVGQSAAIQDG